MTPVGGKVEKVIEKVATGRKASERQKSQQSLFEQDDLKNTMGRKERYKNQEVF
jgi:hypothetical protein